MRRFILIPHIKIHNANAMSSPYTIGFPAMTAWLGAVHALQRFLQQQGLAEVKLNSVAISCHQFDLQTYKGQSDFVHSIISTANPLDKDGSRPAFIEEARCHLTVSLLIEYQGLNSDAQEHFVSLINAQVQRMKFASGDVLSAQRAELQPVDEDNEQEVKKLLNRLMLGYVLVQRRELLQATMQEGQDALDALLDHLKILHRSSQDDDGKVLWKSERKTQGWLVPIATGYQGISELAKAKHQRDSNTPHRFAESVVTLGEFKMPYRITNLDDMLWQYHVEREDNLYLCQTLSNLNLIGA